MGECDIDDLLCQATALAHLKGLRSALGDEKFKSEFPELEQIGEKIASREASLRTALGKCGIGDIELADDNADKEGGGYGFQD